jgi:hypothetical protein
MAAGNFSAAGDGLEVEFLTTDHQDKPGIGA